MGTTETTDLAPAVREILASAGERTAVEAVDGPVSVAGPSLVEALAAAEEAGQAPIIGEVKPNSPTTAVERTIDPVRVARRMESAGAAAISVLTEPDHFGGSPGDLPAVRDAVSVPVLRKDFLLEEAHLDVVPADAVLLIARFLDDLEGMIGAARVRGMTPLVEVHTRAELEDALAAEASVIGINNRDLATLSVDRSTVERLAEDVPPSVTLVAESGIRSLEDRDRMLAAGADGLLIGTAIMDGDVADTTRRLVRR
ncbi:MAG: indole-3-glycerol-phosphate synthase [Halodesulfurarchaeum sp.]